VVHNFFRDIVSCSLIRFCSAVPGGGGVTRRVIEQYKYIDNFTDGVCNDAVQRLILLVPIKKVMIYTQFHRMNCGQR
jgi:hypothetical protein